MKKKHNVLRDINIEQDMKQVSDVLMKRIFKDGKVSLFKMIMAVIIFVIVVTLIPVMIFIFCIACPEPPFSRLSITEIIISRFVFESIVILISQ